MRGSAAVGGPDELQRYPRSLLRRYEQHALSVAGVVGGCAAGRVLGVAAVAARCATVGAVLRPRSGPYAATFLDAEPPGGGTGATRARAVGLVLGLLAGACRGDLPRASEERERAAVVAVLRDAAADAVLEVVDDEPERPGVLRAEPVVLGPTQCPGWRLVRVDRRTAPHGPSGDGRTQETALSPRYYGRDDVGRMHSARALLLCELRMMRWVERGWIEGNNLLLWRGPWALAPDEDCLWREPARSVGVTADGRRIEPSSVVLDPHQRLAVLGEITRRELVAHERCRRSARAAGAGAEAPSEARAESRNDRVDRVVRVTVDGAYGAIVLAREAPAR